MMGILICQVQSLWHFDQGLETGATAIVAQGTETGGHGASVRLCLFVLEIADYLSKKRHQHCFSLLVELRTVADLLQRTNRNI